MTAPGNDGEELVLLKKAIQNGDITETKKLLLQKKSLSQNDINEAFLETIKADKIQIFEYFIEEVDGISLRYSDSKGRRGLHYAVEVGNKDIVKILMKHGTPLNYTDNEGYQAVHVATQNNNLEMLSFLINHGANISGAKTLREGYTPIHIAALLNCPDALEVLVDRVGSLNIQTKRQTDSLTPLHLAVKSSHEKVVKILCEKGACLDLGDREGRTPLHYAADRGNIEIVTILLDHGSSLKIKDNSRRSVLHYAVYSKSVECVQLMIDRGAIVNEVDLSGHTPLVGAVVVASADVVEVLIKNGADVNFRERGHETALLLASSAGNIDVVEKLLKAGADIKAFNSHKETVLHKCQKVPMDKRDKLVEMLVNYGAELSTMDTKGYTPLHNCAFQTVYNNFSISTLKILVEAGALSNFTTTFGGSSTQSPLCWFVWRGYFEAATYLINSGWNLYPEIRMYLPGKTAEQDSFHLWMQDICRQPPTLMQLSRRVIRDQLSKNSRGCEILTSLNVLEIPKTLKEFLMLKH